MGDVTLQSQNGGLISIDWHSFHSMSIGPPIPKIQHFQNLTLKIKGQGQKTMMLHNYRSRQFHRTSNGINPSSGFRDMGSASYGPSAAWFDKFLAHGLAHMGQITMTVHNYRSRQVHETLNVVNPSSRFRDLRSQSLDPICAKFDKFLAHGQAHMGQMGKWPWQYTTRGLDNSTELRIEKIRQAVTEIWVPQVWQPPAQPPARPDRDDNTPPARRAEG